MVQKVGTIKTHLILLKSDHAVKNRCGELLLLLLFLVDVNVLHILLSLE
jgi:hypothetical protein